jgi:TolB protein
VFHSLRTGNRDIFTVEADGTGLRQWTSAEEEELDPDWSPDGEQVVFEVYGRRHGFSTLRLVDGAQPVFKATAGDFAHWSPDGRTIVRHRSDGLVAYPVEGGQDTVLVSNEVDGAEAFYGAWSPDGKKFYYLTRSVRGWTVRSGGEVLVTFDDPTRPQTKYGFCTNGKTFYLTIGSPESDIFVVELGVKQ